MNSTHEFVRSTSANLDLHELLKQPVSELLAVPPAAAAALAPLGINTIFDLGCSRIFTEARVAAFANEELGQAAMHGMTPGDLLADTCSFEASETIGSLPLQALRCLSKTQADALSAALDLATLRDFAQWPPYVYARRLVSGSLGGTEDRDAILTEKLRPTFGEFPTERVYYTTLAMLQMNETATEGMKVLGGGVSLDAALAGRNGFTKPAIGALLTYSQSWYVQGITFGHLLHSLALAPGEATRIAIIDWARRTSATSSEDISEAEQLDSATSHTRAISEVQNAVANEMQEGGSTSSSKADSSSWSDQSTVGTGLLSSLYVSADASGTSQGATSATTANSSSWSLGNRSVAASMSQNINDRTEQHSTSARNRRATAVREVSQSEHEQVSTRIVANYNHMHALTIQYYEIVQVYRVSTRLHRAERCLFIPMERLDFSGPKGAQYIERFRGVLVRAALNNRARELLLDDSSAVEISVSSARIIVPLAKSDLLRTRAKNIVTDSRLAAKAATKGRAAANAESVPAASEEEGSATSFQIRAWDRAQLATASRFLIRPILRPGSNSLFVPDETELLAITFDNITINKLRLDRIDQQAGDTDLSVINGRVDLPAGVRMGELDGLYACHAEGSRGSGLMTLICAHLGRHFNLPAIPVEVGTAMTKIAGFRTDQEDRRKELVAHLQAHNAYYTQAILRSLDSATLVLLLSDYTWNGRPVIDQVEPKPVTVAGNFLVLRAPIDADEPSGFLEGGKEMPWDKLLKQRGFNFADEPDVRVVPIPTNGVFAEAVLGRSNSAEKLEYTRFWNWQDSPIPLQPTEIAPVSTGSRATAENLQPGQLGQPVLNIVNPTSLPDPAGLGAVLSAVANGNMFRDMGGLAGTQRLAGETAQGTLDATTAAAEIAGSNMRAQMQKAVAMGQIAADLAKTAMGIPSAGNKNNSVTAEAARVAHGEKLDAAALSDAGSAGNAGIDARGAGGSSAGGDRDVTNSRSMIAGSGGDSAGKDAFNSALWGSLGMPAGELAKAAMSVAGGLSEAADAAAEAVSSAFSSITPFPEKAYPPQLNSNSELNKLLTDAIAAERGNLPATNQAQLDKVAFTIVKLDFAPQLNYVGINENDMLFSASLLKVILIPASFELVAQVNRLAPTLLPGSEEEFFKQVKQAFDGEIQASIPFINEGPWRKVKYAEVLKTIPDGSGRYSVTLTDKHRSALEKIVSDPYKDDYAADCMHRLGYSYVNGFSAAAGFFDISTKQGIWLASDYKGEWKGFHVPVATNGESSEAMTTLAMARMLAAMYSEKLVDLDSSLEMLNIFKQDGSWISANALKSSVSFKVFGAKVGHYKSADAKVGFVMSEAAFLIRVVDKANFAIVWQNVPDEMGIEPIYRVIDNVVKNWP